MKAIFVVPLLLALAVGALGGPPQLILKFTSIKLEKQTPPNGQTVRFGEFDMVICGNYGYCCTFKNVLRRVKITHTVINVSGCEGHNFYYPPYTAKIIPQGATTFHAINPLPKVKEIGLVGKEWDQKNVRVVLSPFPDFNSVLMGSPGSS